MSSHKYREISHNIPIFVMSRKMWPDYLQPEFPVDARFEVSSMAELAAAARRMKSVHHTVAVVLEKRGQASEMLLRCSTPACVIVSRFSKIRLLPVSGDTSADEEQTLQVAMDSKLLHQLLSAFRRRNTTLTVGLMEKEYASFSLSEQEYSLDYVIPVFN